MRRLAPLLLVLLWLPACGPLSCRSQASDYMSKASVLSQEFSDALTLAEQSPRVALPAQIATMQDIHRRLEALDVPDCAKEVKRHQSFAMVEAITAYTLFLGQQDQAMVQDHLNRATIEVRAASTAIAEIK